MKRLLSIALVLTLAFAGAASAATPQANLPEIEDEVMCPICGTLLGLSRAPAAERQRVFIRKLINEGKTKDEIKDALVAEYGPQVLALPDDEGINFYAYAVPVVVFILAALAILFAVIRWRQNRKKLPPESEHSPPPEGDEDRLNKDLANYDL
ncbi:MAG: cytochrome c-type biogenesis protein [Solirubrobacterales bacterium]